MCLDLAVSNNLSIHFTLNSIQLTISHFKTLNHRSPRPCADNVQVYNPNPWPRHCNISPHHQQGPVSTSPRCRIPNRRAWPLLQVLQFLQDKVDSIKQQLQVLAHLHFSHQLLPSDWLLQWSPVWGDQQSPRLVPVCAELSCQGSHLPTAEPHPSSLAPR